jgi:hypothetical protein
MSDQTTQAYSKGQDTPNVIRFWVLVLVLTVVACVLGFVSGNWLLNNARLDEKCDPAALSNSWQGVRISGLPSQLQSSFGYGRGTQVIDATFTATAQGRPGLPAKAGVFAGPLVADEGTQIPSLSSATNPQEQLGISAVATRIGSSSIYRLEVCIRAPKAAPGTYNSQLLFPGATLAAGNSLPVTVTFQSRAVPFILTVGIAPIVDLGILYCTLILVRRDQPAIKPNRLLPELRKALFSVNGLVALLLGIGAVFTAWNVQVFRDATWGTPWPTILLALGTMAGSAAGAATVPMGFAREDSSASQNADSDTGKES